MKKEIKFIFIILFLVGIIIGNWSNSRPVQAQGVLRTFFTITTPGATPACPAGTTQLLADQNTAITEAPLTSIATTSISPITAITSNNFDTQTENSNKVINSYNTAAAYDGTGHTATPIASGGSASSYTVASTGAATTYTWHYRVCSIP